MILVVSELPKMDALSFLVSLFFWDVTHQLVTFYPFPNVYGNVSVSPSKVTNILEQLLSWCLYAHHHEIWSHFPSMSIFLLDCNHFSILVAAESRPYSVICCWEWPHLLFCSSSCSLIFQCINLGSISKPLLGALTFNMVIFCNTSCFSSTKCPMSQWLPWILGASTITHCDGSFGSLFWMVQLMPKVYLKLG